MLCVYTFKPHLGRGDFLHFVLLCIYIVDIDE